MFRLNPEQLVFVTERHLATLTTLRADGSPHVVPVAFTWDTDAGVARTTARRSSTKVANARRAAADGSRPRAALCQVDGGRWLTLEGTIEVSEDPDEVADAVVRYTKRYRPLEHDPERVVLRLTPDRAMASTYMA
ncbi:pyridoxamine 5'-phosphate oxidase family protein [Krasilnikoviella flava]|uniref:PPOX class probable F420-dependent enzyme n=1 Tax=Krasilnikoviella flava TaxID=526729 RepID=A0A1T5LU77_9MICO|nr:PPOX class F420-dependent oxidoreductase [Krasilnikoviella flava]SKC79552.1 PPOX class probable F420-dependent enzyme [Krasilnikoviella flava]